MHTATLVFSQVMIIFHGIHYKDANAITATTIKIFFLFGTDFQRQTV